MVVETAAGLFLAGAIWQDLRSRKIKNRYNVLGALSGLAIQAAAGNGVKAALCGMTAGFAAGFGLFLLGAVKAGDSKAMWALGTFLGAGAFFNVLICSLLAGGAGGLLILLVKKDGRRRLIRLREYGKSLLYARAYRRYEAEDGWEFPFTACLGAGYLAACMISFV